nr:hypothetical protein [Acidobacteriota bacterium]
MLSERTRARISILICGLAALPWLDAGAFAHEIGTTRVSVTALNHSRFELDVVTDATSLLEKMETVAGEPPSATDDPLALRQRLEILAPIFQQRVAIWFDGQPARPSLSWSVAPSGAIGGGQIATIRLSGDVPPSARSLTWKYAWTFTSYALIDRRSAPGATTQWLEGDQTSGPLLLDAGTPAPSRVRLAGR